MDDCEIIPKPPRNRRKLSDTDMVWDQTLEASLRETLDQDFAIVVELSVFHSSPAKGRLWKEGLRVKHRVLRDRPDYVGAWLERAKEIHYD